MVTDYKSESLENYVQQAHTAVMRRKLVHLAKESKGVLCLYAEDLDMLMIVLEACCQSCWSLCSMPGRILCLMAYFIL